MKDEQRVICINGQLMFNGKRYNELFFEPATPDSYFELKAVTIGIQFHWQRQEDQSFKGALNLIATEKGILAINQVDAEDYLASVISSEMKPTAPKEFLKAHAAICGKMAAQIYNMEILAEGIETNKRNFTRFLAIADPWIADEMMRDETKNKSSLVFALPHTAGSLSKVLSVLSFYDMNLTKIQSLPIIGREWEYLFYINLTFHGPGFLGIGFEISDKCYR